MQQNREVIVIEPTVEFYVAPAGDQRLTTWQQCRDAWLNAIQRRARGSTNTRRAYEHDYNQFFAFYDLWIGPAGDIGLKPWQVGGAHVELWIESLHKAGLTESTINRKLAALSSFYNYASYKFTIPDADRSRALWTQPNPFRIPDRVPVDAYGRSVYPSLDDVTAILRTIANDVNLSPLQRHRDIALLGGLFFTTRRVSEWTALTWGAIHDTGEGVWFDYRYKGGKMKRQAIPALVWNWVRTYLTLDGRYGKQQPPDYIFLATTATANRFRTRAGVGGQVRSGYDPARQPISNHRVNDLLKKYGRRAGIADDLLHAHGLRHAGARARLADGADLHELKDILGHGSIAITQIYTDRVLTTPTDANGDALANRLAKQFKLL